MTKKQLISACGGYARAASINRSNLAKERRNLTKERVDALIARARAWLVINALSKKSSKFRLAFDIAKMRSDYIRLKNAHE